MYNAFVISLQKCAFEINLLFIPNFRAMVQNENFNWIPFGSN